MSDLPAIHIIATTWAPNNSMGLSRAQSAEKAIRSWRQNLSYDGPLVLHLADDGSDLPGYPGILDDVWSLGKRLPPLVGLIHSRQERRGVGASLNRGIEGARFHGALIAYFVDDWELTQPLDLTAWARLLLRDESIGAVRIGIPHPWLTGRIEFPGEDGVEYIMRLDRHHYAASLRPTLYHLRYFDAYGPFEEGCSSYEVERIHNERFCTYREHNEQCQRVSRYGGNANFYCEGCHPSYPQGPDIVLGILHPWNHVGDAEVGDITPGMGL